MNRIATILVCLSLSAPLMAAEPGESAQADPSTKTLVWPDGTRYVGGVENGKRSGRGTIFWKDGTRFVGSFKDDKRNGPGTMILPDGTVYNGVFRNDKLVDQATAGEPASPEVVVTEIAGNAEIEPQQPQTQDVPKQQTPPPQAPMLPERITRMDDSVKRELTRMVELWAAAWSEKNVPQYLSYYAQDFDVPGKQSRSSWEALRRSRLLRPDYIGVSLVFSKFEIVKPDTAEVTFQQTYKSDVYSDITEKTLLLGKEGISWKILEERGN